MPFEPSRRTRRIVFSLCAALSIAQPAVADDDRRTPPVARLPKYQQECGACHLAYPPGMLPAASWQRTMNSLPHHFGTDASLDAADLQQLSGWLRANAGTYKRVRETPRQDRITLSSWFVRKHDEVPASAWKLAAVKSASNCAACHTRADQGFFHERDIRIPR